MSEIVGRRKYLKHVGVGLAALDSRIYFGMGGTPVPYIRDIDTGQMRRPSKKDMDEATRLGDALPNMKFLMTDNGATT